MLRNEINKNKYGFTLIELMIVISLISIIYIISFPSYSYVKRDNQLYSEAMKIKQDIMYIQQLAIDRGIPFSMKFCANSYQITDGGLFTQTKNFDNGVIYYSGANITFDKNGIPSGASTIKLKKDNIYFIEIKLGTGGTVNISW